MRSSAGAQIKFGNVDQTQITGLFGRKLAQAKLARFLQRHKTYAYRAIFSNDLICQVFHFLRLLG
jgi:hypothetical protein